MPEEWNANISCRCGADPEGVSKAVDMLLSAERPVILVGQGIKYGGATAELLQLAERLKIPVAYSATGQGAIPSEHPLSLGLIARGGAYQANNASRHADVLLALGVRFDDRTSSSWLPGYSFTIPPTKLIHVDIDPDEIARNYPVALGLMADVRTFLRQVLAELDERRATSEVPASRQNWLSSIDGWREQWNELIAPGFTNESSPIDPQRAAREIDLALPEDAIMVSDIGVHHNWLVQFCRPSRPDSVIGSMGFGPMGFGVAGALGAKLAAPDRPVCLSLRRRSISYACQRFLPQPSNIQFPSSGWFGTIIPMPQSAASSAAISTGASSSPTSSIPKPASPIIPTLPPWPARLALRGSVIDRPGDLFRCGQGRHCHGQNLI